MPDPNPIAELQRRLLELGCPVKATRHIVREAAEHFEDLQRAAVGRGLSPSEAVANASEQFGDPAGIARKHVEVLRNASWLGRHSVFSFMLLPFVIFCLIWMPNLNWVSSVESSVLLGTNDPRIFLPEYYGFAAVTLLLKGLCTLFICRLAMRSARPIRYALLTAFLLGLSSVWPYQHTDIVIVGTQIRLPIQNPVLRSAITNASNGKDFQGWNLVHDPASPPGKIYQDMLDEFWRMPRPSFASPNWKIIDSEIDPLSADAPFTPTGDAGWQYYQGYGVTNDGDNQYSFERSVQKEFSLPVLSTWQPSKSLFILNLTLPFLILLACKIWRIQTKRWVLGEGMLAA